MRPSTSSFVVIRPRICAELCMRDAVAFSQYEQGGYLGSPILSSAVFSTRDHRGAGFALPRPAPDSRVPLGVRIRTYDRIVKASTIDGRRWVRERGTFPKRSLVRVAETCACDAAGDGMRHQRPLF